MDITYKSPGLKPDWLDETRSFSIKKLDILLDFSCSRIFPQIGGNDTGW